MTPLYRLGTAAYHAGLRTAAWAGHERARAWVTGRAGQTVPPKPEGGKRLWMHCASLGEWEQGRPVLQALRDQLPEEWEFILSFYSPSGFTRVRADALVQQVLYLPADTPAGAEAWARRLAPDLAIFVKYEFWFYHLRALQRLGVPTWLVAANFRPQQAFFRVWGGWHRRLLRLFTGIVTQTSGSRELLVERGNYPSEQTFTAGDPRMDRTLELAAAPFDDPALASFCEGHRVILAGSVWPPDTEAWRKAWPHVSQDWRIIFAPHQLYEEELALTQEQWKAERYTRVSPAESREARVLILDTIGILSRAYRYADVAYVGGAFKTGLHNTLEPMAYGLPTIFGPRHEKFPEAASAISEGGAFTIRTASELAQLITQLEQPEFYDKAAARQQQLARSLAGAGRSTAEIILNHAGSEAL